MDKELPDKHGVLLDMYGNEEFSRDVIGQFPTLRADLEEDAGLLHVQMGTLAGAVRQALALGETDLPIRICRFLGDMLGNPRAVSEIENAVAISFLEAREFRDTVAGRAVWNQMPKAVQELLLQRERRSGTA
jgi:hypothetical protein